MASLSSSAQIRLLGGGGGGGGGNVAFWQRSSLNSNRVSFGSLPPRSSSLTLSSSSNNARTSYGILSVAPAKGDNDSTSSCYDALERLAIEAGKILAKEVANMLFEEARAQLPEGVDVERLVEEAANAWSTGETKEKRSGDIAKTENHASASGNGTSYDALFERSATKGKVLLVKDLTNTFEEEITPQKIKEKRAADEAGRVMAEEEAAKTFAERKMTERVMAEEAAKWFAERRIADEAERVMSEEAAARKIRENRFADEFERVMAEEAAALKIKEKRVADEAEEAAKKLAEHKIKEKRVAEEFERVMAEETAARKIEVKSSGDIDETQKHASFGAEGWVDAVDEFFGLMKPYLTSVRDSYDVGDYIKIRIGTDVIKGVVISKDYNVTRLETFSDKTTLSPMKRIIVIDNNRISWVEILDQSL